MAVIVPTSSFLPVSGLLVPCELLDEDVEINFQEETTPNDIVSVIVTQPLTGNETWHRMKPGEFGIFHFGELIDGNADELADVAYAPKKVASQAPTEPLE